MLKQLKAADDTSVKYCPGPREPLEFCYTRDLALQCFHLLSSARGDTATGLGQALRSKNSFKSSGLVAGLHRFALYAFSNSESKGEQISFCKQVQTLLALCVRSACTTQESTEADMGSRSGKCADTHKYVLSSIFLLVTVRPQHLLSASGADGYNQQVQLLEKA